MKEKIKSSLTVVLLLFASVTLGVQIGKEFRTVRPIRLSNGLNVVCTHATARCTTCLTVERLTQELLDAVFSKQIESGRIVFRDVNFEQPEANDFCAEYEVATSSVVLVDVREGKAVAGVNLADEVWKLHTDGPKFKDMLKKHIETMLEGKVLETDDSSEEIDLGDEDIELPL